MGNDDTTRVEQEDMPDFGRGDRVTGNMKAFMQFRKTLEREIENALLEKMRAFRDEILRSKLK
jgi:hypothetical protein